MGIEQKAPGLKSPGRAGRVWRRGSLNKPGAQTAGLLIYLLACGTRSRSRREQYRSRAACSQPQLDCAAQLRLKPSYSLAAPKLAAKTRSVAAIRPDQDRRLKPSRSQSILSLIAADTLDQNHDWPLKPSCGQHVLKRNRGSFIGSRPGPAAKTQSQLTQTKSHHRGRKKYFRN